MYFVKQRNNEPVLNSERLFDLRLITIRVLNILVYPIRYTDILSVNGSNRMDLSDLLIIKIN